jgi:hypothetical protein
MIIPSVPTTLAVGAALALLVALLPYPRKRGSLTGPDSGVGFGPKDMRWREHVQEGSLVGSTSLFADDLESLFARDACEDPRFAANALNSP